MAVGGIRAGPWMGALLLLLAWTGDGSAHVRSESFSHWNYQEGTLSARFTVTARDAARIPTSEPGLDRASELARYLAATVEPYDAAGRCPVDGAFRPVDSRPGYLQLAARWRCHRPPETVAIRSFFDLAAEHVHFATLEVSGRTVQRLLTGAHPTLEVAASGPTGSAHEAVFTSFVGLGFRHILSGADHLLFLLVLFIACHRLREIVWAVTGFTLGHSLTLGLAATGVVEPNLPAVEATIGLTIALVAVERAAPGMRNPWAFALLCAGSLVMLAALPLRLGGPDPVLLIALALFVLCYLMLAREAGARGSFRLLVTALFGLVHGLGFASAFAAVPVQPGQGLWPLAGFNVGVELGQLAVVGLMGTAAAIVNTRPRAASLSGDVAGAVGCAMGVYWFVERGFA